MRYTAILFIVLSSCAQSPPQPTQYYGNPLPRLYHSHQTLPREATPLPPPTPLTNPGNQGAIDQITKAQIELRSLQTKVQAKEDARTPKEGF